MSTHHLKTSILSFTLLVQLANVASAHYLDPENSYLGGDSPINSSNVGSLVPDWVYLTAPDTYTPNTPIASVSATPAWKGKYIYFNDLSGNITKLNRFTGALIWKKNYATDASLGGLSIPGYRVKESRNTPVIKDNMILVGSNYGLTDPVCAASPTPGCISGDGAVLLALDKKDGRVLWRAKVDSHPSAKITGSVTVSGQMILVPVGTWEEDWARKYPNIYVPGTNTIAQPNAIDPNSPYPCCSFRGSLVALDLQGNILWKSYTVPGDGNGPDANGPLTAEEKALLTPHGFYGTSTYGNYPTVDTKRKLVYIATAQNSTAPKVAELCEQTRRLNNNTPQADIDPTIKPSGFTWPTGMNCLNMNVRLHNYANSIVAMRLTDGKVVWSYQTHLYDSWNHACGAPDFYGMGNVAPLVFPVPVSNAQNCYQDPVGPDEGFGHQPLLMKNIKLADGMYHDLVVAGNKDGRMFAIDADSKQKVWETVVDPGGIYGGMQFGRTTDGKTIFVGTSNSRNMNRDKNVPFTSNKAFLTANGFDSIPIRVGEFVQSDTSAPVPIPAPSSLVLPFPGPGLVYGTAGYEFAPFLLGPASGPSSYWTLVNPPSDIVIDQKTVFQNLPNGPITTIDGMICAVDVATGQIRWQRPANDGIAGSIGPGFASGTITNVNGVIYVGYMDVKGTMVALDAKTGRKLFQFNATIPVRNSDNSITQLQSGDIEGAPLIVGRRVYWGVGAETIAPFPDASFSLRAGGNRLYSFKLPIQSDDDEDGVDKNTEYND